MNENPSVLIIGAGPTGLMMAAQLSRFGISYRIIDKSADHTTQSRALVVQARSLEIFDQLGIAPEALVQGEQATAVTIVVKGRQVLRMSLGDVGMGLTRYPYLLILEQSKTEQLLTDFLSHHGQQVERQTELVDFVADTTGVAATLRDALGHEEVIRAAWLVGADGVHSHVRQRLQIPFLGKTYQQSLFVLDCEASLPLPRDEMVVMFSERAFTGLFPLTNGRVRVLGTVPHALEGQDTITFADVAATFAERVGMDIRLFNPEWISLYHAHHRVVSTFRAGRCFLAGDAAHIHSPVGAQGMNTGLQDAYNLAWKLALVCQNKAQDALLSTYNDERLGIAQSLVQTTDRAFYYVNSQQPLLKTLRLQVMPLLLPMVWSLVQRQPFMRQLGFKTISEIGIQYRKSQLSQQEPGATFPKHAPMPGDRLPYTGAADDAHADTLNIQDEIDGTALCLLVFPGGQQRELLHAFTNFIQHQYASITIKTILLSTHTRHIYKCLGMSMGGYYLVRPDLYIAYRGQQWNPTPLDLYLKSFLLPYT